LFYDHTLLPSPALSLLSGFDFYRDSWRILLVDIQENPIWTKKNVSHKEGLSSNIANFALSTSVFELWKSCPML
jgi:hypothetical protein